MLPLLILLLQWRVTTCTSSPTLEDNMLPTDEEFISDLINSYRGQPEQEIALNLPTDEEAFNEIKPILQSGNPLYYINSGGHFISSSFPEIDSRGFHESVFDDADDFFPISQRGKKYDSTLAVSARGFYGDVFTDGFGSFHPVKRNRADGDVILPFSSYSVNRHKRSLPKLEQKNEMLKNLQSRNVDEGPLTVRCTTDGSSGSRRCTTQNNSTDSIFSFMLKNDDSSSWGLLNFDQKTYPYNVTSNIRYRNVSNAVPFRYKRNVHSLPYHPKSWKSLIGQLRDTIHRKRKPEVDSADFYNDIFDKIGEFDTLRKKRKLYLPIEDKFSQDEYSSYFEPLKRVPAIDKSGFHADVFHNQFGKFDTLKRAPDMGKSGFHGDVFHKSFGNFETLKKRVPAVHTKVFNGDAFNRDFGHFDTLRKRKRKPDIMQTGFARNFQIYPMKRILSSDNFKMFSKRRPRDNGFDDGVFDYDSFNTVKRRPTPPVLNGDAFHSNFGSFDTMKRTLGENLFHSQFGRFETMKRNPPIDLTQYNGDLFRDQLNDYEMLKRAPELVSLLFHRSNAFPSEKSKFYYFNPRSYSPSYYEDLTSEYERFKNFIRNFALTSKFDDLKEKSRFDETNSTSNFRRTNSSKLTTTV